MREIVDLLLDWYKKEKRDLPWRKNKDPYRVWLSEIMCQQTRVDTVIPYYFRFVETLHDVSDLAKVDDDSLMSLWQGLGYYSRAFNLRKAARIIMDEFDGIFPENYQDVLSLPGVGRYTAGAICSICYDQRIAAVDGNVVRVISRYLRESVVDDDKVKQRYKAMLEEIYPINGSGEFTQSLMELGALICIPNGKPKCELCPLRLNCQGHISNQELQYPVKKTKNEKKEEHWTLLFVLDGEKMLVEKRPSTGLLANLYQPLMIPGKCDKQQIGDFLKGKGIEFDSITALGEKQHVFSHLKWQLYPFVVEFKGSSFDYNWIMNDESVNLPTAFKKCLK